MLTKILGPTVVVTASATTQTVTVSNTVQAGNLNVIKVRIASTQNVFVDFGKPATATGSLMLPQNTAEHFKLDSTSTVSILQAASGGLVTITPVA